MKKNILNCVFTLLYIKYIVLFICSHCFVVNILFIVVDIDDSFENQ